MKQQLVIQSSRLGIYILLLVLALMTYFMQQGFWNWQLLKYLYLTIVLGIFLQGLPLFFLEDFFKSTKLLSFSFVVDVLLISFLFLKSELNQSLFLFMYLFSIILCGLVFRARGALLLACLISICFTVVSILGPELRSLQFFFLLVLNNVAFFIVAGLSSYLGEQLNLLGEKLQAQNLTLSVIRRINENIIQTVPAALLTTNQDGCILTANRAAEKLFSNSELPGRRMLDIIPSWDSQFHHQELSLPKGSETLLLKVSTLNQPAENLVESTKLIVVEDLTQLRKLEFSVRQSEKMVAIGQLAAGIAHEIRNPLTGISGSVELLSQSSNNADDKKLTKIILKEIDRLNNLITEFLEFAKPEKIPHDPVVVAEIVKQALDLAQAHAPRDTQNKFLVQGDSTIYGNADKLKQAFLNIIINAYQAMNGIALPELKVTVTNNQGQLQLRIQDNGIGMKEEIKSRIFEPFMTTKPKGTGLGLAITHKILQSHGAQVYIESDLGRGTEFVITFHTGPNS